MFNLISEIVNRVTNHKWQCLLKSLRAVKLFFLLKEKEGVKNEKKYNENDILSLSAKEKLAQVII